jgi:hypothetical protein
MCRRRILLALLLVSVLVFAKSKEFQMPKVNPANMYPAHDDHPAEKLTVAADPYDMPDKASIFQIKYAAGDYLPVFMVFTNNGDAPASLENMQVQLVTHNRDKIPTATEDDLYRRFSHAKHGGQPSRLPLPIPLPGSEKVGVKKGQRDEINAAMFQAKAVAPHESQAGFVFFDISGISQPLSGAHIYVTGVTNGNGQELMYFDIPMENYLTNSGGTRP